MRRVVAGEALDPGRHHVGPAQIGEHPSERRGGRDRRHRDRVEQPGIGEIARQVLDVPAVHERDQDEDDIGDRDEAGLGRGEEARENAAHDDERDHQRQRRELRRLGELAEGGALSPDAARSEEMAEDHQPEADEEARHDAAEEQPADRDVAGRAVDDRHDARRDQVGDRRGRGDERRREGLVVALPAHLRPDGARQHRDVGGRRAGDAGEEHREHRHDLREAAAEMADERLGERDHAVGDVCRRHQLADEEEERHREQRLRSRCRGRAGRRSSRG